MVQWHGSLPVTWALKVGSGLLASSWPSPGISGIWGENMEHMEDSFLSLSLFPLPDWLLYNQSINQSIYLLILKHYFDKE